MAEGSGTEGTAIIDRERFALATASTRIPRAAWASLEQTATLLDAANSILAQAHRDADAIRARAEEQGLAAGRAAGIAAVAGALNEAQQAARDFVDRSETRLAELACAIVERIVPRLRADAVVPSLIAETMRVAQAERYVLVRVHPDALDAASAEIEHWRIAYPAIASMQVLADDTLPPLGCVVETEFGTVQAGLDSQLQVVRAQLAAASSAPSDPLP